MAIILAAAILLPGCEKIVGKLPPAPPGPPAGALPTGVLQRGYNFSIKVTSSGPPTFAVSSGTLPAGISLAIDGTLFGTPTTPGLFNFVIDITDGNGTTAAGMSLEIVSELALATSTLPNGFQGIDYLQDLSATGGLPGYTWENLDLGTDPPGLDITNAGPGNATYSGVPTTPGIYQLNVRITDNGNPAVLPGFVDATIQIAIAGAPASYITNSGDGTVSVIDMSTDTPGPVLNVGTDPRGIALSTDGASAFVTNFGSGDVSIIDTINNVVTNTVTVGNNPLGVVQPRGGSVVYVANQADNTVSVFDAGATPPAVTATLDFNASFPGGEPKGLEASPDGELVFLTMSNVFDLTDPLQPVDVPDKVIVINNNPNAPVFHSIVDVVDVGEGPSDIRYSPSTGLVIVTNELSQEVSILTLDLATSSLAEKVKVPLLGAPSGLGVGPRCNRVHVSRAADATVTPVDVNWEVPRSEIPVAAGPRGIGFNPDGNKMYVAQSASNQVRIINLNSGAESTVTVGSGPFAIASQVNPSFRLAPTLPDLMPEGGFDVEYRSRVCATGAVPPYTFSLLDGELPPGLSMDDTGLVNGTPTDASIPDFPDLWTFGVAVTDSAVDPRTLNESLNLKLQVCCLGNPALMYVANSIDNSVTVIEPSRQTLVTTITDGIGSQPLGVAITPDGTRVLVTNSLSSSVSIIDADPNSATFNRVVAIIPVAAAPDGIAILPDGTKAYVASQIDPAPSSSVIGKVSVIDLTKPAFDKSFDVGIKPSGVAASTDGSRVYVANKDSRTVSVINTATDSVVTAVPVGLDPIGVDFDGVGNRVYVANQGSNTVSVIDAANNTVVATIPVGDAPTGVIIDDLGSRRAYVANQQEDTVSVIDLGTNQEIDLNTDTATIDRISVGSKPDFLAARGIRIYVTNSASKNVSRIMNNPGADQDNTVTETITVGAGPEGVKVQGGR